MKIVVLSDIHGNLPALRAVAEHFEPWRPDLVIVNGDIVNRGPCSGAALSFVLNKREIEGWQLLRGNHEDYLLRCGQQDLVTSGPTFELNRFAYFAYQQLNGGEKQLAEMPEQFSWFSPDGSEFRVVHASMRNNRDGIYQDLTDDELRLRIAPSPAVFVTGHTHQPLLRRVDETLVVNAGSVGAPFDLDWRPSYGRFSWNPQHGWRSGFLQDGGPLAQIMLVELRRARGLIYYWANKYEDAVTSGEIRIEESVKRILQEEQFRPYLRPPGWVF
jgi:putative phosphoesterase